MGIGASYTGNGVTRTFELDGVPPVGSLAADMLGAQAMHAPQLAGSVAPLALPSMPEIPKMPSMSDNMDKGKVSLFDGDMPDVLSRKVLPGGSIVAGAGGLCLKGEEGGTPGGTRLYAAANGTSGFLTFEQIDPYGGGIPMTGAGDTPSGSSVQLDGKQGASMRMGGRTHLSTEITPDGTVWLVVKDFYRMADISPHGRIVRVSAEIEVPVLRLKIGGSGNGKYGVRPFFVEADAEDKVHPVPDAFAFGAEADLDTYDESSGQFACNYDGDGNLLDDPPVKIVMTTPNTGGS